MALGLPVAPKIPSSNNLVTGSKLRSCEIATCEPVESHLEAYDIWDPYAELWTVNHIPAAGEATVCEKRMPGRIKSPDPMQLVKNEREVLVSRYLLHLEQVAGDDRATQRVIQVFSDAVQRLDERMADLHRARQERNAERNGRKAKKKVRQYAKANGLRNLWTATYIGDGERCREKAMGDAARWLSNIVRKYGKMPYVVVLEWHPKGHGWHVHVAFNRFLPIGFLRRSWQRTTGQTPKYKGSGKNKRLVVNGARVNVTPIRTRKGGPGKIETCARYLAKYVSKSFDLAGAGEAREGGKHRYEVGQGFQPESETAEFCTQAEAVAELERVRGSAAFHWKSEEQEGWIGPKCAVLMWRIKDRKQKL